MTTQEQANSKDIVEMKLDIAKNGAKLDGIISLCNKMDIVIEKIMVQHDRHLDKVYLDMETRNRETNADIKDLHIKIEKVRENVENSVKETEEKILKEIGKIRDEIKIQNEKDTLIVHKLLEWKWTIVGGLFVVTFLLSNADLRNLVKNIFFH